MHVIHHHPPPSKYRPSTPIEPLRCWWRLGKLNRNPSGQQRGHFKDFVKRGHLCVIDLCKWPFCILGLSGFHWRADVTAWYIYIYIYLYIYICQMSVGVEVWIALSILLFNFLFLFSYSLRPSSSLSLFLSLSPRVA